MSSISNNKDLINLESLDDWLENDLRQSGIILPSTTSVEQTPKVMPLPSPQSKPMTPAEVLMASPPISECTPHIGPTILDQKSPAVKFEPLSPVEAPNTDSSVDTSTNKEQPALNLQPFIKALTLLGTMQTLQNNNTNNNHNKLTDTNAIHQLFHQINTTNVNQTTPTNTDTLTSASATTITNTTASSVASDNINSNNKRERDEITTDQPKSQQDLIALKRQRNTDAARRSRLRKALKMEALEKRVLDLETENEQLKLRAAVAESERANIEAKEKSSRVRILELERQLATTYKALVQYSTAKA